MILTAAYRYQKGVVAIESPDSPQLPRRNFARNVLLALFGAFAVGVVALRQWLHSRPDSARVIAHAEDLPVGGSMIFQFPGPTDPCILIRPVADKYLAFSRLCTHNACPIFYRSDLNEFICPCHSGAFSASDGSVLQGPPPKPLPRVSLELRGSDIVATGLIRT